MSEKPNKQPRYLGVFVLFVVLAACGAVLVFAFGNWTAPARAKKLKNPVPATPEAIASGRKIYAEHCQRCHGENGDGKGPKSSELSIAPQDFTDAHTMSRITDGEFFWQVSQGHRPMPAFKDKLTEQERWQVVDYIRTFAQKSPGVR